MSELAIIQEIVQGADFEFIGGSIESTPYYRRGIVETGGKPHFKDILEGIYHEGEVELKLLNIASGLNTIQHIRKHPSVRGVRWEFGAFGVYVSFYLIAYEEIDDNLLHA